MPQKQKIALEEKVRIVRDCLGGKVSISEAAREVGADNETVKMWVNIYENEGVTGFAHHGKKKGEGKNSLTAEAETEGKTDPVPTGKQTVR